MRHLGTGLRATVKDGLESGWRSRGHFHPWGLSASLHPTHLRWEERAAHPTPLCSSAQAAPTAALGRALTAGSCPYPYRRSLPLRFRFPF